MFNFGLEEELRICINRAVFFYLLFRFILRDFELLLSAEGVLMKVKVLHGIVVEKKKYV